MYYVYVVGTYSLALLGGKEFSQILKHSKHEHEAEAEAVCLELERLGYDCWVEEEGILSDE